MDNIINKTLAALGLEPKEIKFYQTCFKLGSATINEVAKESHLQRSTAYLVAQQLLQKGFLEEDLKSYKKKITALEPTKILQMLSARQRTLKRQELELEENLPLLQAEYQASEIRPKVKVFEGKQGLVSVWKDILSTKGEILLWTNQQTENKVFDKQAHDKFIQERISKRIKIRVLAVNNPQAKELQKLDHLALRETKLLPPNTEFSAETYIYDNKVAILDYNKDIMGIIIESLPISAYHKAIFEMNWDHISGKI
ncbi:MAG: hypothetical protein M1514_02470 [Patescibacteria group bacterium]|nr:hypothetical protein [Patescibacteria group bacterium]